MSEKGLTCSKLTSDSWSLLRCTKMVCRWSRRLLGGEESVFGQESGRQAQLSKQIPPSVTFICKAQQEEARMAGDEEASGASGHSWAQRRPSRARSWGVSWYGERIEWCDFISCTWIFHNAQAYPLSNLCKCLFCTCVYPLPLSKVFGILTPLSPPPTSRTILSESGSIHSLMCI